VRGLSSVSLRPSSRRSSLLGRAHCRRGEGERVQPVLREEREVIDRPMLEDDRMEVRQEDLFLLIATLGAV